ncbi:MAG: type I DNA topoisomerase [Legionellales bacterium]|nr:type I DNA topoisomerase [Legionellales bacterium]
MSQHLLIVESPAKAKTIKKYLGNQFTVMASYGHVRDLLPQSGSVDPKNHFAMNYDIIERNARHVEAIAKNLRKADSLYLATDPDREGEAISWHVQQLMEERQLLNGKPVHRVVFHEITKSAVSHAVENPRQISMDLVNAQQARRALDYLVGFNLSPLLWRKIRRGLSAGRVQSPALRMIVEREEEIERFVSQEYWSIKADLIASDQPFIAKLTHYQGEKLSQFSVTNAEQAQSIEHELSQLANGQLTVQHIDKKQRKRNPAAPFITSTLQQEAARKLGFTARRTMMVAQQLYEGIEIGQGTVGLITYMRTDSVTLANQAIDEIRELIAKRYGKENLPSSPRRYKTKAKNAQEAHEAIRPTSIMRTPTQLKDHLSAEQLKLYDLIWKRTVACQMIHATIDTVAIDFICGNDKNIFRANGSTIANPGFIAVYQEGRDDIKTDTTDGGMLPIMQEGQTIPLTKLYGEQHFTEPPPRYSEASLVKALEEYGIGRPSTYASIIQTLQHREYVVLEQKRFIPTDVGRVVNRFLTQYFTQYVDYNFTANLEDALDAISRGEKQWIPVLDDFWDPFINQVKQIDQSVDRSQVTTEQMDEACPKCGKPLSIRLGKRGRFIGCTGYPDCDYTSNIGEQASNEPQVIADRKCPKCEHDLVIKHGPYGKFIGCSNYPNCKFIEPFEKPEDTEVPCPKCHQGNLLKRKSRRGKIFYSCATYPKCDYAIWNPPLAEPCPKCQWPILTLKTTKRHGEQKVCPQPECKFTENVADSSS